METLKLLPFRCTRKNSMHAKKLSPRRLSSPWMRIHRPKDVQVDTASIPIHVEKLSIRIQDGDYSSPHCTTESATTCCQGSNLLIADSGNLKLGDFELASSFINKKPNRFAPLYPSTSRSKKHKPLSHHRTRHTIFPMVANSSPQIWRIYYFFHSDSRGKNMSITSWYLL